MKSTYEANELAAIYHKLPLQLFSLSLSQVKAYPDQDALVLEVNVCDSDLVAERHDG